jgi:hypothetical protein
MRCRCWVSWRRNRLRKISPGSAAIQCGGSVIACRAEREADCNIRTVAKLSISPVDPVVVGNLNGTWAVQTRSGKESTDTKCIVMVARLIASAAVLVAYPTASGYDLHFVTKTRRPLREICDTLPERVHWRISFEEPPWSASSFGRRARTCERYSGFWRRRRSTITTSRQTPSSWPCFS